MKRKLALSLVFSVLAFAFVWLLVGAGNAVAQDPSPTAPLGPSFTYQGRLMDGETPANGTYNLRFYLWEDESKTVSAGVFPEFGPQEVSVVDGLFTVELNFGNSAFTGEERWLEIEVNDSRLSPLQSITPAPYALSLQPGAVISGAVPPGAGVLNLNSDQNGLLITSASNNGVQIDHAGNDGIFICATGTEVECTDSGRNNGIEIGSTEHYGILIDNTVRDGLRVENAGWDGLRVRYPMDDGINIETAGDNAIEIDDATNNGVQIEHAGGDGIFICATGSETTCLPDVVGKSGVEIGNAQNSGVRIGAAGDNGLMVGSAGLDGLRVFDAGDDGLQIVSAGDDGVYVNSAGGSGVVVDSASNDGVHVNSAGKYGVQVTHAMSDGLFICATGNESCGSNDIYRNNGVEIGDAEHYGILVDSVGLDGVRVNHAEGDGLFVCATGTETCFGGYASNNGVEISSAEHSGVLVDSAGVHGVAVFSAGLDGVWVASAGDYAGYFTGNIRVTGSCSGCVIATSGINTSDQHLLPGEVVSLDGIMESPTSETPMLMQVSPAKTGQPLIGVVTGWMALVERENPETGLVEQQLVPRDGGVAPGAYAQIVIYGPVQVQSSTAVAMGERVKIDSGGLLTPMQTVMVEGVQLSESAPTLGMALEDTTKGGLVWVLVNPQ